MKIGFDMMLWTTHVTGEHRAIMEDIKKTGYDGLEIPIFEGTPDYYNQLGRVLDDIGLERTGIAVIGGLHQNPLSEDPAHRRAGVEHMTWVLDCCEAMRAKVVGGPLHSTIGHFSGNPPTAEEKERARDFHREVGDVATKRGVRVALEAINRFECYFVNTMDDLCTYVVSVGHPAIQAMYDTFHANLEEADPIAAFKRNAKHVIHVHISENNRGVPGRGHVPWAETYKAIRGSGYDGWLTIEAFGRSLPALGAATKIWRDLSETPEAVYREGFVNIRDGWAAGAPKRKTARKAARKAVKARTSAARSRRAERPKRTLAKPKGKPTARRTANQGARKRLVLGGKKKKRTAPRRNSL